LLIENDRARRTLGSNFKAQLLIAQANKQIVMFSNTKTQISNLKSGTWQKS
jgi:hypothetical protein